MSNTQFAKFSVKNDRKCKERYDFYQAQMRPAVSKPGQSHQNT